MKSNICELNKDLTCLEAVLAEVEKVTGYNGLEGKNALRLRLLAEELCGMLPGLVENFSGEFWAGNEGNSYELHVSLKSEDMSLDLRDELISVSKSGKNAAAKCKEVKVGKLTLEHINRFENEIKEAGIDTEEVSPKLLPDYRRK